MSSSDRSAESCAPLPPLGVDTASRGYRGKAAALRRDDGGTTRQRDSTGNSAAPTRLICSAPGRAGIIGNPTDMYGGSVISCSVALRACVTLTPSGGPLILETNGEECRVSGRDDLRPRGDLFDIARAILDYLHLPPWESEMAADDGGLASRDRGGAPPMDCRVHYQSDIPLRSGLAGSTALLVALLQSFLTWQGKRVNLYQLAERARYIELNYLKVVCGYQDACMCTFGGLNYMDFRGKQFYRRAEAELFATIEPLAAYVERLPFVLGFTGIQHASSAVHKPIRERWLDGEPAVVDGYKRITEIAQLGKKALLLEDWRTLGRLMNENHAIQRDLGGSGESNERLIAAALQAGALGAKLAGAGDGGTIIALWPWEDVRLLEESLYAAGATTIYRPQVVPGVTVEVPIPTGGSPGEAEA